MAIMGYVRFVLAALYMVVALIITLPFLLIIYLIGLVSMKARDALVLFTVRASFKTILLIAGVRLHVTGLENIPKDRAVLYIGNHRSFFDILTTYTLFPNMTAFVSKDDMKKVPILSWWMLMLHNLFLDRKDLKQGLKVILKAIDYVNEGYSVCIFPEGTRNKTDEVDLLPFKEGSFKVATKTGCPIIPMTLYNTAEVFEKHFPQLIPHDVMVDFGKPINPDEIEKEDKKHIGAYTREIIVKRYAELRDEFEKLNFK